MLRENKNLSLEVKDLLAQIGEGSRSLHEAERQKKRLECEKEEMASALGASINYVSIS